MVQRFDWNTLDAYNEIDTTHEGFLNHRNIQTFLRLNGHVASDSELIAIVRRMDSDADQRISFDEFREAASPIVFEYPSTHPE